MFRCFGWKSFVLFLLSAGIAILAIVLQHPKNLENDYPDLGKTIDELIQSRGFESERHFITTGSGYILQLNRILNPHVKNRLALKPVLLHHGFQCSGSLWLVASAGKLLDNGKYVENSNNNNNNNGQESVGNSLGFVLAARGYDVWLANYRGNIYSRNHTTLKPDDDVEFWKFTIDDMVAQDLTAQIDYVRRVTGRASIGYIGHSQGNFMMFALLAARTEYSQRVKPFIALSPVTHLSHLEAPMRHAKHIRPQLLRFRPKDFGTNLFRKLRIPAICANPLLRENVCYYLYWYLFGSQRNQIDFTRLPVHFDNILHGSSMRNYIQLLQAKSNIKYYDFADEESGTEKENLRRYGREYPPAYRFSRINSTDIALIYTKRDWFNHMIDIYMLKDSLEVKLLDDYQVPNDEWNHMDLVWATEVGALVNTRILQLLGKY